MWTFGAEGGNLLSSFDLKTGAVLGTGGTTTPAGIVRHFTSPIVVHGKIYAAGETVSSSTSFAP